MCDFYSYQRIVILYLKVLKISIKDDIAGEITVKSHMLTT